MCNLMVSALLATCPAPASTPAETTTHAETDTDFERAIVEARLARDPVRLCETWLQRGEFLLADSPAEAQVALTTVVTIADRYEPFPEVRSRLADIKHHAGRRLAELAFEEARDVESITSALDALLLWIDSPQQRAFWSARAGMRLDDLGARPAAIAAFRAAAGEVDEPWLSRWLSAVLDLLDGRPGVDSGAMEAVVAEAPAHADDSYLAFLLPLFSETAWQTGDRATVESARRAIAAYADRPLADATRHRLTVHAVPTARLLREPVPPQARDATVSAWKWFSDAGNVRDAAQAALVIASLIPPGPERARWRSTALDAATTLQSFDPSAAAESAAREAALGAVESTDLAMAFASGNAQFDPLIEDRDAFAARVRASFAVAVRVAYASGDFEQAFRRSQQAKAAEVGIRVSLDQTISLDTLSHRYALQHENLEAPTADLVVEYFVDDTVTFLFGLRADAGRERYQRVQARVDVDRAVLADRVLQFIASLDADSTAEGRALFDLFIQPIWGSWNAPWAVIAPDGPLRFLPFDLLPAPATDPARPLLASITSDRDAIERHLARRRTVLNRPGSRQINIVRAQGMGLWPPAPGRISYLPTTAVLNNDALATPETALRMWSRSAEDIRAQIDRPIAESLAVIAPRWATTTARGTVLSLWANPVGDGGGSDVYFQRVFSFGGQDLGPNLDGRVVGQLKRDLQGRYQMEKNGRDAKLVDVGVPHSARDWARWIFVDLREVERPL